MNIAVINGPNLNLLGVREPDIYGRTTLGELEARVVAYARERGATVRCSQHNAEGAIIDELHGLRGWADGIIINPAAYTHYSIAVRDAIAAVAIPTIEVHLSDIAAREPWRKTSVTADVCIAQIKGLGVDSYLRAVDALLEGRR